MIDKCETIWNEPNPQKFAKFENNKRKITGVQKFNIKGTVLDINSSVHAKDGQDCKVTFRVKPVDLRLAYRDPRFINLDAVKE